MRNADQLLKDDLVLPKVFPRTLKVQKIRAYDLDWVALNIVNPGAVSDLQSIVAMGNKSIPRRTPIFDEKAGLYLGDNVPHAQPQGEKKMMARAEDMWQCQTVNCGYIYDPDRGDRKGKIPKGTRFEDLPDDWKCPICGASKKMFRSLGRT